MLAGYLLHLGAQTLQTIRDAACAAVPVVLCSTDIPSPTSPVGWEGRNQSLEGLPRGCEAHSNSGRVQDSGPLVGNVRGLGKA